MMRNYAGKYGALQKKKHDEKRTKNFLLEHWGKEKPKEKTKKKEITEQ